MLNLNEAGLPMYNDTEGWPREQFDRRIAWTARQIDLLDADYGAQIMRDFRDSRDALHNDHPMSQPSHLTTKGGVP